jgi:glutaredoxin
MTESRITFYGADWCADCRRSKAFLESHDVAYTFIDVVEDAAAAEKVAGLTGNNTTIPVIFFDDGAMLIEPSDEVLEAKLTELAIL